MVKVGVLVGSLSRQAYSLRLAQYLATRLPEVEMLQLDYSELPFYNPDLERTTPPMEWTAFREAVRQVDGFLIVMPEYNLSIPAALKNALDVISVPARQLCQYKGNRHWQLQIHQAAGVGCLLMRTCIKSCKHSVLRFCQRTSQLERLVKFSWEMS